MDHLPRWEEFARVTVVGDVEALKVCDALAQRDPKNFAGLRPAEVIRKLDAIAAEMIGHWRTEAHKVKSLQGQLKAARKALGMQP